MHAKQIPTIEFNTAAPSPTEQSQRAIVSQDILWIKPYCGLMQAVAIDRQGVTHRQQTRPVKSVGNEPTYRTKAFVAVAPSALGRDGSWNHPWGGVQGFGPCTL